ncbi:MAG: hypothetical protein ABI460_13245 [Caldimonas sp.]
MDVLRWIALSAVAFAPFGSWAEGDGIAANADRVPWARFQGRVAYTATPALLRGSNFSRDGTGLQVKGLSLMGDVYFGATPAPGKNTVGGFRATSGVILGTRSTLLGTPALTPAIGLSNVDRRLFGPSATSSGYSNDQNNDAIGTLPYIGIGYSSLALRSGWSFSADLGVVSLSPGNVSHLGRVFGGSQSLDDVVRDMRLTPVLQLGASYSF